MGDKEDLGPSRSNVLRQPIQNQLRSDIQSIKTDFADHNLPQLRQMVYISPRPPGIEGKKQDETTAILVQHALDGNFIAFNQTWQTEGVYVKNNASSNMVAHDILQLFRETEQTNAIEAFNRHNKPSGTLHFNAASDANISIAKLRANVYGGDQVKEKKSLDEETTKIVISGTKDPQAREDATNAAIAIFGAAVVTAALISLDRERPGDSYTAMAFQTSKEVQKELLERLKHMMAIETDATTLKKLRQSYDQLAAESKNAYESESAEKKRQAGKIDNILGGEAYSVRNAMFWMEHADRFVSVKPEEWVPPRRA